MPLDDWLTLIQAGHPREIELGLERVRSVWQRLGAPTIARRVITVGGTNGKGSTVAFIDAIARAQGLRVGRYTSPHLLRFNERIAIAGVDVDDLSLIHAFERIEAVRGQMALTFFEFTTLAALLLFADAGLDLAVLEVGLGGRLDAVNLIDADVAVVTTVALDHQDWLGHDREQIAVEKAGIFRAGAIAVLGERSPAATLLNVATTMGARICRRDVDFSIAVDGHEWQWRGKTRQISAIPRPAMVAPVQLDNAASAIAALLALATEIQIDDASIRAGVRSAIAPARLETRIIAGREVVFDVAHNPQAADSLAQWLRAHPKPTVAVCSVLADKDLAAIIAALDTEIDHWVVCGLDQLTSRGRNAKAMRDALSRASVRGDVHMDETPVQALASALRACSPAGRVLVFGSFYLIGALDQIADG